MDVKLYDKVQERLYGVEDPEIGINIVDLGLVYDIDSNGKELFLTITLTSAACPLSENIELQIRDVLDDLGMPINFFWTFVPSWNTSMLSEDGIDMLRSMGGTVPSY